MCPFSKIEKSENHSTLPHSQFILQMEDVDGTCNEGGNRSSPAPKEPPGSLELEDVDGTCDEGGNRSCPAPEEPPGILQLIDQLETMSDHS